MYTMLGHTKQFDLGNLQILNFQSKIIIDHISSLDTVAILQTVSCDEFLPRTHAHSHTRFSAARSSHARVRFAKILIAHARVRLCIRVLSKFAHARARFAKIRTRTFA
jgi:hypothetical protein